VPALARAEVDARNVVCAEEGAVGKHDDLDDDKSQVARCIRMGR
jgi:hypothetical protein